ncbi:MAG: hypothetical protein KH045_13055 [Megamonas funiformis]|uniref:hypothetical protein n=1 Tax=Megamonas funiformis TaxID=437897 RepID=UPI001ECC7936|nr:hypothetical protein [Megamonas funiformis]MBS7213444.1 hypothetical protein [Megamonas funiformis]
MDEKKLKLMNDAIRVIRNFCKDLDIDCSNENCSFSVNCPVHTIKPPCNWINLEKEENKNE